MPCTACGPRQRQPMPHALADPTGQTTRARIERPANQSDRRIQRLPNPSDLPPRSTRGQGDDPPTSSRRGDDGRRLVRNVKQVIDLLRQIAEVAPGARPRRPRAGGGCRRESWRRRACLRARRTMIRPGEVGSPRFGPHDVEVSGGGAALARGRARRPALVDPVPNHQRPGHLVGLRPGPPDRPRRCARVRRCPGRNMCVFGLPITLRRSSSCRRRDRGSTRPWFNGRATTLVIAVGSSWVRRRARGHQRRQGGDPGLRARAGTAPDARLATGTFRTSIRPTEKTTRRHPGGPATPRRSTGVAGRASEARRRVIGGLSAPDLAGHYAPRDHRCDRRPCCNAERFRRTRQRRPGRTSRPDQPRLGAINLPEVLKEALFAHHVPTEPAGCFLDGFVGDSISGDRSPSRRRHGAGDEACSLNLATIRLRSSAAHLAFGGVESAHEDPRVGRLIAYRAVDALHPVRHASGRYLRFRSEMLGSVKQTPHAIAGLTQFGTTARRRYGVRRPYRRIKVSSGAISNRRSRPRRAHRRHLCANDLERRCVRNRSGLRSAAPACAPSVAGGTDLPQSCSSCAGAPRSSRVDRPDRGGAWTEYPPRPATLRVCRGSSRRARAAPDVALDWDPEGEDKVLAAICYPAHDLQSPAADACAPARRRSHRVGRRR